MFCYALVLVSILLSSVFIVPLALAEEEKIPYWLRNIFIWHGENKISDTEVLNALSYLTKNDIIKETPSTIWKPKPNTSWNWQLDGDIDASYDVQMYDIDLFDSDKEMIDFLHTKGIKVVCYISVGSWEEWRPDARQFPSHVLGNDYSGWAGEKWLDIRRIDAIGPVIEKRLDLCKSKGFDGIEPDNIDGYTNESGFPLTYEDQLKFNIWLANQAHKRGLSIGLKNDPEQIVDLLLYFDWALTEDCFAEGWCDKYHLFTKTGKAVFQAEYTDNNLTTEQFCPQASKMNFSAILKNRDLTAWQEKCS